MDLSSVYNNPDYSDLTIVLKDGREIKAHKNIVCTNEWFKKACGAHSRFAEASQGKIELLHDDPDALERVISNIYRVSMPRRHYNSWRHWLNVFLTADKYLEHEFSSQARNRVRDLAFRLSRRNTDEILNLISTIENQMSHDETLVKLAVQLRQAHIKFLLKNDRFRNMLDDNKDLRWEVIEYLSAPKSPGVEQVFCLCSNHESQIFASRGYYQSLTRCTMCLSDGRTVQQDAKIAVCDNWNAEIVYDPARHTRV